MTHVSYNKKLFKALKHQNRRRDLMEGFAGFIGNAALGYQQEQGRQEADRMGQQAGFAPGTARNVNQSVLAQAILAQRNREAEHAQRRADLEYELGERGKVAEAERTARAAEADADRRARAAELTQTLGTREDQFDRELDQRKAEAAAQEKRYSELNQNYIERERMQQAGQTFRTGMQEIGDTVRGIGGGIKDFAVAAMKRKPASGPQGFGLSADADRLYKQKQSQREQVQNEIYQWNAFIGKAPNRDGRLATPPRPDSPQAQQAYAELDRLNKLDQALGAEIEQLDVAARGGVLATPMEQESGDDYDRF